MKLNEAKRRLDSIINVPFEEWMSPKQLEGIIRNKGKTGQLLEIALGLKNTPNKLDFEDGELKTNKCDKYGNPLETMFITQILSTVDYLLYRKDFYGSRLYKKIDNLLYVPICKEGYPEEWFFLPYEHVNLNKNKYYDLKMQLEDDYYYICDQLIEQIEYGEDGNIHTSNGEFIQIRSKDSKPYSPIYSKKYGKYVSNKNHAFYFKKKFMRYITS